MQTVQDKPKFRDDLVATELETDGVRYVDVKDPGSGSSFRFFEVEYALAQAMNGERDLAAIAAWARSEVGVDTSAEELASVQATLATLGYLIGTTAGPVAAPAGDGVRAGTTDATSMIESERAATPPPVAAKAPGDETSFGDVLVDEQAGRAAALPPPPSMPAIEVIPEAPAQAASGADEVSVDLSAHLSLDKKQVAEAVKASRVMQAVAPPIDMVDDEPADNEVTHARSSGDFGDHGEEATRIAPEVAELARREQSRERPVEAAPVEKPVEKAVEAKPVAKPVEAAPVEKPVEAKPVAKPAESKPAESKPAVETKAASKLPERPQAAAAATTTSAPAPQKSSSTPFLLVLLLLAAGGAAVYWFFLREQPAPPAAPPPVVVQPAPPPKPAPPPPLELQVEAKALAALELASPAAGKVSSVASAGEVVAGTALVTLAGTAKWETQRTQASARRDFYQAELDKAKAANNAAQVASFETKVKEKADLVAAAEGELAKLTITAAEAGTAELLVAANAQVTAGQVVVKLVPTRQQKLIRADKLEGFEDPDTHTVQLLKKGDNGTPVALPVSKNDDPAGPPFVILLPDDAPIAVGDTIQLLPLVR